MGYEIKPGANLSEADLRGSDLSGSDLSGANLRGADLRGANLREADLREACFAYCIGNNKEIKTLQTGSWTIVYTKTHLFIGCETHSIKEWFKFTDNRINSMAPSALTFWRKWKPALKEILKMELLEEDDKSTIKR